MNFNCKYQIRRRRREEERGNEEFRLENGWIGYFGSSVACRDKLQSFSMSMTPSFLLRWDGNSRVYRLSHDAPNWQKRFTALKMQPLWINISLVAFCLFLGRLPFFGQLQFFDARAWLKCSESIWLFIACNNRCQCSHFCWLFRLHLVKFWSKLVENDLSVGFGSFWSFWLMISTSIG